MPDRRGDGHGGDSFGKAASAPDGFAALTPTQRKVLHAVHHGLPNKQIAFDLGIAEATVKAHMTALMRKLNVRNRTQVAIATQGLQEQQGVAPDRTPARRAA